MQNTPTTTSTLAKPTNFMFARFFANTIRQNGMIKPPITSIQKNGAVTPPAITASASAPFAPGYAMVRHSQPMKNASTAMHTASKPAKLEISLFSTLNRPDLFKPISASSKSARPESIADATKMGAMMAEYQSFAICRPKIHAVTL